MRKCLKGEEGGGKEEDRRERMKTFRGSGETEKGRKEKREEEREMTKG